MALWGKPASFVCAHKDGIVRIFLVDDGSSLHSRMSFHPILILVVASWLGVCTLLGGAWSVRPRLIVMSACWIRVRFCALDLFTQRRFSSHQSRNMYYVFIINVVIVGTFCEVLTSR